MLDFGDNDLDPHIIYQGLRAGEKGRFGFPVSMAAADFCSAVPSKDWLHTPTKRPKSVDIRCLLTYCIGQA